MGIIRVMKLNEKGLAGEVFAEFDLIEDAHDYMFNVVQRSDPEGFDNGCYILEGPREVLDCSPAPRVGMPATVCYYTDRDPATVVRVSKTLKTVFVKLDKWKVVDGSEYNGSAKYRYEHDPEADEIEFRLRKNGRWVRAGESTKEGTRLVLGRRRRFYDPHF